jgi:hypothetical protein
MATLRVVLGPILIIVAMLALIPMFLIGGGILMALTGKLFKDHAEETHAGSELIDTNY